MKLSKSLFAVVSSIAVAAGIAACATIVDGTQQEVKFEVRGTDRAKCVVYNEDYKYNVYAPAEVTLERSRKDLDADCSGEGGRHIKFVIPSYQGGSGAVALNVSNGIIPGTAIDVVDGAYFNFPNPVIIDFDVEDGYRASEVTEVQVNEDAYDVRDIWPDDMSVGESSKEKVTAPAAVQEVIETQTTTYETDEQDEKPMPTTELLNRTYNKNVFTHEAPKSITVTEEEITVKDEGAYKYEEIINNNMMQPVISPEDMTAENAPDIFEENIGEFDAIEPAAAPSAKMSPIVEDENPDIRQKVVISPETTHIRNVQMQPIIEEPKKPTPPRKINRKDIVKPQVSAVEKPTQSKMTVTKKTAAVLNNVSTQARATAASASSWINDISAFAIEDSLNLIEDNADESGDMTWKAVDTVLPLADSNSDDMPIGAENAQKYLPLDTLSEIETSSTTTIGAATADGQTQDMDAFMHDLMHDLEAAMPPAAENTQ